MQNANTKQELLTSQTNRINAKDVLIQKSIESLRYRAVYAVAQKWAYPTSATTSRWLCKIVLILKRLSRTLLALHCLHT